MDGYDSRGQGGGALDRFAIAGHVPPWFDHKAARRSGRVRAARCPNCREEVRRGVTDGEAHDLWQLPVDLDWVAMVLEADPMRCPGAYLDLQTGEVIPCATSDNEIAGDHGPDIRKAEPDRWLFLPCLGSRAVREDMAEFAAMIKYLPMRPRVEQVIEGLGAFHRFRDLIYAEGLASDWDAFSGQRRIARAREFLADLGVRVTAN